MRSAFAQHPLSAVFPPMGDEELFDLAEDIREHGLHEAVVLYAGKVLDGWHRYQACQINGIAARTTEYPGEDPVAYVMSKNAHRRHLTASQRAAVVVRCSEWRDSGVTSRSVPGTDLPPTNKTLANQTRLLGSWQ